MLIITIGNISVYISTLLNFSYVIKYRRTVLESPYCFSKHLHCRQLSSLVTNHKFTKYITCANGFCFISSNQRVKPIKT